MQSPEWLKPALYGAVGGAIALAIVGFSWGGWVTGGKAEMIADQRARPDVVAALKAICADQAKRDPLLAERVALLKTTASYGRGDLIMKNGWATIPGTAEPNRQGANRVADKGGVWAGSRGAGRTGRETVTFARPFRLRGVDEAQPAGAYTVETDEEPIEGLSFMAYRRVATVIFLPLARGGQGSFQAVPVDPPALEAAIAADKAAG